MGHNLVHKVYRILLQMMFILTMVFQAPEALTTLPLANTDAAWIYSSSNTWQIFSSLVLNRGTPQHLLTSVLPVMFSAETSQLETLWPSESADRSARLWGSTSSKWQRLLEPRSSSRSFRCDLEQKAASGLHVSLSNKELLFKLLFCCLCYLPLWVWDQIIHVHVSAADCAFFVMCIL